MPAAMAEMQAETGDETLIRRVAQGDRGAFHTLYERHKDLVFNVAYRICGNRSDAEDLTQDSFLAVYTLAGTFEGRARVTSWLTSIVLNKSINAAKQVRRRRSILRRITSSPGPAPAPQDDRAQALLAKASPEDRGLFTLRYVLNFSYEEMAEVYDCPLGTLKSRLFHAHNRMRSALTAEGVRP